MLLKSNICPFCKLDIDVCFDDVFYQYLISGRSYNNRENTIHCMIRILCNIQYDFDDDIYDILWKIDCSLSIGDNVVNLYNRVEILKKYITKRSDSLLKKGNTNLSNFCECITYNSELLGWFIINYQNKVDVIDNLYNTIFTNREMARLWYNIIHNNIYVRSEYIKKNVKIGSIYIDRLKRLRDTSEWVKKVNNYFMILEN